MLSHEGAALGKAFDQAVNQDRIVRQFAPALGGVGEQRPRTTLDVDPAVAFGSASVVGQLVERVLLSHDGFGERFQHLRTLMERHRAQGGAADIARVCEHPREIAYCGAGLGNGIAAHRGCDG